MTVDEMLAAARARMDRISPRECAAAMSGGALLVDIRPQAQRRLEGEVPGAVLIERNVLEWRLDPASPDRMPEVDGYDRVTTLVLAPFLFPANPLIVARAGLARVAAGLADALRASTALVGRAGDDDDRRAVLRRVADDIARLSADLQRLGPQLASAGRAARWAVVRRSAMRATAELEPTRLLAGRLAQHLEVSPPSC